MSTTVKDREAKVLDLKAKQMQRANTCEKVEYELNHFSERFDAARAANLEAYDAKTWAALKRAAHDLKDALTDITFDRRNG